MTAPGRSRPTVALVAALLVFAQLAGFAHEAAVRHVRCAEHGELVEATDAGATSVYGDSGIRGIDHGGTSAVDHEHCTIASATHEQGCGRSVYVYVYVYVYAGEGVGDVSVSASVSVSDRYRLAPKTSPPVLES